jgi:hypothetical protein
MGSLEKSGVSVIRGCCPAAERDGEKEQGEPSGESDEKHSDLKH